MYITYAVVITSLVSPTNHVSLDCQYMPTSSHISYSFLHLSCSLPSPPHVLPLPLTTHLLPPSSPCPLPASRLLPVFAEICVVPTHDQ